MPTQIEQIADQIAAIITTHGADSDAGRTAMDQLLMDHGPKAVEEAGQLALARIRG
ncbi:MAG: hypothetical protein HOW97_18005 [Catenulispora sp.]|nr:hypothetical protein [Catenulispora sp.]